MPETVRGAATAEASSEWAAQFEKFRASAHFRKPNPSTPGPAAGWRIASIGIGTYLGEADDATDARYRAALRAAVAGGINLIDTAINYRHQRSERALGAVLREQAHLRPALAICSKVGYLPFERDLPADPRSWLIDTYIKPGLIPSGQLAGGSHCIAPVWLAQQLERSLENLGLETLDVLYLHNPEAQQAELSREEFYRRLRSAFEFLEKAAASGRIQYYGVATWSGLRVPPDAREYLDLNRMVALAREIAGDRHRFRFLQAPYNLAMPEAYTLLNQVVEKPPYVSLLNAAWRLGVNVVASATLMNGRLQALPADAREHLRRFLPPMESDAELAIQFVRSSTGVLAALVGMADVAHVAASLRAAAVPPAPPAQVGQLLQA